MPTIAELDDAVRRRATANTPWPKYEPSPAAREAVLRINSERRLYLAVQAVLNRVRDDGLIGWENPAIAELGAARDQFALYH